MASSSRRTAHQTHELPKLSSSSIREALSAGPHRLSRVPIDDQQMVLDVFKDAFSTRIDEELPLLIQKVKQHLYNRDFIKAFNGKASLEAYAIRWSPSRALAYLDIFCNLPQLVINRADHSWEIALPPFGSATGMFSSMATDVNDENGSLKRQQQEQQRQITVPDDQMEKLHIVCLGGGSGAELVALGGFWRQVDAYLGGDAREHNPSPGTSSLHFNVTIVDMADWSNIIQKLHSGVTVPPLLSEYASISEKDANVAMADSGRFDVKFVQHDILNADSRQLESLLEGAKLVTLMFTLNELYQSSIKATTHLLLTMTSVLAPGSLLLVVDSPGSYSTVELNKLSTRETSKRYPMQWLLDHTLLEAATITGGRNSSSRRQWKKVYTQESSWFRLAGTLKYPVDLEDMRYQLHLFERV